MRIRPLAIALAWLAGCGDGSEPPPPDALRTNPFLGDGRVAAFQLDEEFELDLTGDGALERVVVTVGGETIRTLEIEMTISTPGGTLLHGDSWSAGDYPEIRRASDLPEWVASEAVRSRLGELLADDAVYPLPADGIDRSSLARELRLEEWRAERGLAATSVPGPDDEAEVAANRIPEERIDEIAAELVGRTAVSYMAGAEYRTIAWSPRFGRFVSVLACC